MEFIFNLRKDSILAIVLIVFMSVSCKDDALYDADMSDRIVYSLGSGYSLEQTRSAEGLRERFETRFSDKIILGKDTVNMDFSMADCLPVFGTELGDIATRGDLIDSVSKIESVNIHAFADEGMNPLFSETIKIEGNTTSYYSKNLWTKPRLAFGSWIGINNVEWTYDKDKSILSGGFHYEIGAGESDDVMIAIAENCTPGKPVWLNYHHALSTVEFNFNGLPAGIQVDAIEIADVYTEGQCKFYRASSDNNSETGDESIKFDWTIDYSKLTTTLKWERPKNFADAAPSNVRFFVIPQKIGDKAIKLRFSDGVNHYLIYKELSKANKSDDSNSKLASLKSDVRYCFNIGIPDDVQLYIYDTVDGWSKKNLTIANKGHGPGYLRFALLAYVTDSDGNILRSIEKESFENNLLDYNVEGFPEELKYNEDDGYYYYLKPLTPTGNTFDFVSIGDGTFLTLIKDYPDIDGEQVYVDILCQLVSTYNWDVSKWKLKTESEESKSETD